MLSYIFWIQGGETSLVWSQKETEDEHGTC